MPQYYFHVRKDGRVPDTAGVDLSDLDEAQRRAATVMGEKLKSHPGGFWKDEEWHIEVTDNRGLILFTLFTTGMRSAATQG